MFIYLFTVKNNGNVTFKDFQRNHMFWKINIVSFLINKKRIL